VRNLRAVDAIHENIAEGCGFNSDPQLAKYLRQARGSADETQDELKTLTRRGFITPEFEDLLAKNPNALPEALAVYRDRRTASKKSPKAPYRTLRLAAAEAVRTAASRSRKPKKPAAGRTAASRQPAVSRRRRP